MPVCVLNLSCQSMFYPILKGIAVWESPLNRYLIRLKPLMVTTVVEMDSGVG